MLIAFSLIIIHFLADVILQKGEWAIGKSKNWKDLLSHTFTYSVVWLIPIMFLFPAYESGINYFINSILFCLITFICHTITDYFTSRWSSREYEKKNFGTSIPRGFDYFVILFFDQILHYAQLFLTFHYISKLIW